MTYSCSEHPDNRIKSNLHKNKRPQAYDSLRASCWNKYTSLVSLRGQKKPPEAREQFAQGRAALAKKSYLEAISHLEKAVFAYPSFFEAQLLLATAFIDTRQWAKAESALQ